MPWPSWLTPAEVSFDQTPIWVRLKSIPLFYWNKTNLQELAGKVSAVYELPRLIEKNFERGSFGMGTLCFRATVDVNKPLFSGFFLRRKGIKDLWIQYQYEKLPNICFKCRALSHDQKHCFKTPTVIKDDKGAFFPMFGSWMDEEAVEKSPFHLPLLKWFNDWITQQEALKDPTVVVENRVETGEVVLNRFSTVLLLGTGEITPFENTAEGVVEKVIPEQPPEKMVTAHDTPTNTVTETMSTEEVRPEDGSVPLSHFGEANNKGEIPVFTPNARNETYLEIARTVWARLMILRMNPF
uniref:Zinc knuckle CX2CX4HX4C domain-containing protein n=1 Tax=Cannabis sativa TaxID=3483 RepID=A0A803NGW3_CANSA